jgi:hypothetical protein
VFELAEEAFDAVALLVEVFVVAGDRGAGFCEGDDRLGAGLVIAARKWSAS